MSLTRYRQKRDFKVTPEPRGAAPRAHAQLSYCIQKHAASRLHYDFRLELDGVLKSWAVPKGPSRTAGEKRLAVHVEDHPLEYGQFEGTIPAGEYGGGTVMLWDRGAWTPVGDPHFGYNKGHIDFELHGEKLTGGWRLIRMAGEEGKNWLLMKRSDDAALPAGEDERFLETESRSVKTGRTMDEIAAGVRGAATWKSNRPAAGKRAASGVRARIAAAAERGRAASGAAAPAPRQAAPRKTRKSASAKPAVPPDGDEESLPLDALAELPNARRAPQPDELAPQLATLARSAPVGSDWVHEIKFDGYRLLAFLAAGKVRLITRRGNDWTGRFPEVARAVAKIPAAQAILDGEVVVIAADGRHDFQALQNAMRSRDRSAIVYCVFDLPHCDGFDLTRCPLLQRKRVLRGLLESTPGKRLCYSGHVRGHGPEMLAQTCRLKLEGIISKRIDSIYVPRRGHSWLKSKCSKRQEFIVGGYTDPSGTRIGFGALLLGYHQQGRLLYAGKVGTGFDDAELRRLLQRMQKLAVSRSPFDVPVPRPDARGAHWISPELVIEAEFSEWTGDGRLRHPSYMGLREDKRPSEVVREVPEPTAAAQEQAEAETESSPPPSAPRPAPASSRSRAKRSSAAPPASAPPAAPAPTAARPRAARGKSGDAQIEGVRLSSPEKVLYPEQGYTKRDLANYYVAVAEWALPHIAGRPLSLVRCPEGRERSCFFQKHMAISMGAHIKGVRVQEKSGVGVYVYIEDLQGLLTLVQMGTLEIHVWGSQVDQYERPDRMFFDLDPDPSVDFARVVDAAALLRTRLADLGLETFLKNTGGKGLHVVAPLERRSSWDDVREFSEALARALAAEMPDRFTANMSKAKRVGRIYIDYLRNGQGATAIAAYSTRARPGAPVSAPLEWSELSADLAPNAFTIANTPQRLAKLKRDPWGKIDQVRQRLTAAMLKQVRGSAK